MFCGNPVSAVQESKRYWARAVEVKQPTASSQQRQTAPPFRRGTAALKMGTGRCVTIFCG
jgi:hypothetical protein